MPHLSRDDCILSRFTRAGFLYAHSRRSPIDVDQLALTRPPCGVLQIADDASHEARMADALAAFAYPAEYAQLLSRDAASSRAGRPVRAGGWWIPMGDWARPSAVVRAQLTAAMHAQTPASQTLPIVVASFTSDFTISFSFINAAGVLAIIPPVILALAFERYIVSGLTAGAVKG